MPAELDLGTISPEDLYDSLTAAVFWDRVVYLTEDGQQVAAFVPGCPQAPGQDTLKDS